MTKQREKKPITGIVFLILSLLFALIFGMLEYPVEMEADPEGLLSFSGVDLYAFLQTAGWFFGVAVLCLLGAFFGVMAMVVKLPSPLKLGGLAAGLMNLSLCAVHIFQHGEFLFAMLEALEF